MGAKPSRHLVFTLLALLLTTVEPALAAKGVFQGRVVEGNKREAGKYIYVSARAGYLRRVNIQRCRVRFDASIPASQRVRGASEFLRDSAEVRVTAEQSNNGEWVALEILILKVPEIDQNRLQTWAQLPLSPGRQ
jgi:hypothetical protein